MAKETIFYQEDDVMVTDIRCVMGAEVVLMRSVTSLKGTRLRLDYAVPAAIFIFGAVVFAVLFAIDERIWSAVGAVIAIAGIAVAIFRKRPFAVVIRTTSGEIIRHWSDDRDDITKIIAALNEAITGQEESTDQPDSPVDGQEVVDGEEVADGQGDQGEQKKVD